MNGAETFCIPEAKIRTSFNEDLHLRMREERNEDDIVVLSLHRNMKRCVSVCVHHIQVALCIAQRTHQFIVLVDHC